MEHKFIYTQKLSQTLQLSQTMKNSLDILKMSKQDLLEYIKALRICISSCRKRFP